MSQLILGVVAITAGLIFCFRGYLAMRAVIGIWGSFVGFSLGAGLVSAINGQPLLSGPFGWISAFIGAVVLGGLAYAFYAVAVILAMGSVGYGLGSALAGLFSLPPWVQVLFGAVGAALLVLLALITNMPEILLILTAASGGATAIIAGFLLVTGLLSPSAAMEPGVLAGVLNKYWWLYLTYVVLFIAGLVTQLSKRSTANLRAAYN